MDKQLNILAIEDREVDFQLITQHLEKNGLAARCCRLADLENLKAAVEKGGWDIVLSDYSVPRLDFNDTLGVLRARCPDLPLILVSGSIGEEKAVEFLKLGVWDFVLKDNLARLVPAIERCLRDAADQRARRAAEAALSESERLLRQVIDLVPHHIFAKDRHGRYLFVNRTAAEAVGRRPEEMVGRSELEFSFNKTHTEAFLKDDQEVIASGVPKFIPEEPATCSDGQVYFFQTTKMPFTPPGSVEQCVMGVAVDITERKRAEAALRQAEEKYRGIFEHAVEGIYQSTPEGTILSANPAMAAIHGYASPEEFIAGVRDIAHQLYVDPGRREEFKRLMEEQGQVVGFESQVRRKDGRLIWISANARPVRDASGKTLHYEGTVEDITERKRAEEALRENEARLRALGDNIPSGALYQLLAPPDGRNRYTYVSAGIEKLFGIPAARVLAYPLAFWDCIMEEDRPRIDAEQERSARELTVFDCEFRQHTLTGEIKWVHARSTPRRLEDGSILWDGVVADITERKQKEAAIKLFRALVDRSNDTIEVVDPATGRFLDVNEKGCQATGYSREEFLTLKVFDVDPLVDESVFARNVEQLRNSGFLMWEGFRRRKDGSTFPVEVNIKYVQLERDYIVAVVRDVTERRREEEVQARLATAVEQAAESIVITDATGAILYANPAFEKTSGYAREEVIGRTPRMLKSGKHGAEFYRQMWETLARGEVWNGHFINRKKDGTIYREDATISPVRDATGRIVNYVAVKRDVTREAQLEAQLLRAQRLDSIGTLASGIAHDLNNILQPIQMAAETLRSGEHNEERQNLIEIVEASAIRGADIVKQVLTFARGVEGKRESLQLRHVIKEIVHIARETFPKQIMITTFTPQNLWTILGDATQLHQVILNLFVNARDAMPKGGTLSLKAENFMVDENFASMVPGAKCGPHILIQVCDTGEGIPQEIIDRIFDPFFTTKGVGKGSGLGLSTALGIVKGHGGFIQVSSEPGNGATFQVYLPATLGKESMPDADQLPALPSGRGELVLVVDDEPNILEVTRRILTRHGYEVLLARDGTEGIAMFADARSRIKLVLSDIMMPGVDGLTMIRTLRKINPAIPVIVSSGLLKGPDRLQNDVDLEALHLAAALAKPYPTSELLTTVRRLLDEAEAARAAAQPEKDAGTGI